jgi:hypothetical protein
MPARGAVALHAGKKKDDPKVVLVARTRRVAGLHVDHLNS